MNSPLNSPPLPSSFGNYALADFVEVVPPDSISWLPQTVGWLWLAVALLGATLHYGWRALRRWYRNRYRREAIGRLQALAENPNSAELVADINCVLKITAVFAYTREQVASLSGQNWTNFLNQQCDTPPFNDQQQRLLATGIYRRENDVPGLNQQLVDASLLWIAQHKVTSDV